MNGLTLSLILLLACSSNSNTVEPAIKSSAPDGNTPTQSPSASASQPVKPVLQEGSQTMGQNMDQGQQHPPLPADNPAWDWDAQSFVPDFGWYGEHSWTDVRMRVVGHMAMGYRDLARIHILQEDWNAAILVYQEMIQTLQAVDTASSKFAEEIRMVLLKSAERDVQILRALHTKADFPEVSPDALMHWRIEYWKLIQSGAPYDQQQISRIQQEIKQRYTTPTVSPIDEFENFTDRHKLRTELFNAYTQALDPILPTDLRWGYWRPAEIQRQAGALLMALDTLRADYTQPTPSICYPLQKVGGYSRTLPCLKGHSTIESMSCMGKIPSSLPVTSPTDYEIRNWISPRNNSDAYRRVIRSLMLVVNLDRWGLVP